MPRLEPYVPTPAARASRLVMTVLPVVIGLACVLLSFVPMGRIFGTAAMPSFALMAIYYWAVVRPEMFPVYAVFSVGLLCDFLSAGPIGLWAFVYVFTYIVVLTQRFLGVNATFLVFWLGFLMTACLSGLIAWGVASIVFGMVLTLKPVMQNIVVTVAVFPLFSFLFGFIQNRISPSI